VLIPPTDVPFSQPEDDSTITYAPRAPAHTNDVGPSLFLNPTNKPISPRLQSIFDEHSKWRTADFESMTISELLHLPELAQVAAISRGIKLSDIIHHKSAPPLNEQAKSGDHV